MASGNTPQADIDPFLAATTQSLPFTLSWTHYVFLLTIKNEPERRFYELEATTQNWKVRELKRQFDSSLYERLALSRDKNSVRELARKGQLVETARDILKEPLVLEFLGLNEQTSYSESDLENAIINQIEQFLLELGKGFLFEARQKRFSFDGDHFRLRFQQRFHPLRQFQQGCANLAQLFRYLDHAAQAGLVPV